MSQHALYAPSAMHRRISCIGSAAMEDGLPDTPNEYSDEGSAAHHLAACCLKFNHDPAQYFKREIAIWTTPEGDAEGADFRDLLDNDGEYQASKKFIRRQFPVNEEMIGAVRRYCNFVRGLAKDGDLFVEQALPIGHITGELKADGTPATGTGDAIVLRTVARRIAVVDLKYGRGVEVSAEENEQGMSYGLGALQKYSLLGDFDFVDIYIFQPRLHDEPSLWSISTGELEVWGESLRATVRDSEIARSHKINWFGTSSEYLNPSEDNCRFCKALAGVEWTPGKHGCPAAEAKVVVALGAEITDLTTEDDIERQQLVKSLVDPVSDIGAKGDALEFVELWVKAVRAKIESLIFRGEHVNNWKAVAGKKGNRYWSDEPAVATKMNKSYRMKQDEIYKIELKSPTAVEEILKDQPKRWAELKEFVKQDDGKPSVARLSDRRAAITMKPLVDEIAAIPTINPEEWV